MMSLQGQGQYGRMKQYWEVARKDVRLLDVLATGSYSEVWRGRMRKNPDANDVVKVAIKKMMGRMHCKVAPCCKVL